MKKILKNVLLVSSVGLAGYAFAVTNTHPVFAASNAATNANSSQDVVSAQTQVNEAQKKVDQTQSQLNAAESQLSTANNNLDQKNADLQNAKEAVDNANSKVASASSDNSSAQSQLDRAQSDVDSANSDINNYQSQISDLQKKKDGLSPKLDAAQEALNAKQQKIDAATQDLQKAQKDLGEATSTNEQFPLPQSYIDYVTGKSTDWDTAKKDLQDAIANHTYPFTDGDASDTVYDDPSALSDSDSKRLSFYVKNLIDSIKSQVSSQNKLTITNSSLEYAKRYTQNYQNSKYLFRKINAIDSASAEMGINQYAVNGNDIAANRQVTGLSIGYMGTYYSYGTTKMSEIAKAAFDLVTQDLANSANYNNIINSNGYFSVAVTTQDDKFYVCLLTINPSGVPSNFDTKEIVPASKDEITAKEDAVKQAQSALDQAKNDASAEQSAYDQLQTQSQELDQQISDLQAKLNAAQAKKTPKKATKKLTKKTIKKSSKKAKSTKKTTKKKVAKKVKKAKKVVVASSKFTSLKGSKKAFVGKWKKAKSVSGYQVRYSTASSMKKAKTKSTKATKLKVSGLKSKKKYYVQLRSYRKLSNKTYYSAWTKAKTVKTR